MTFLHKTKKDNYRRQSYSSQTPLIKLTLHLVNLKLIWNLKPLDVKQYMLKPFVFSVCWIKNYTLQCVDNSLELVHTFSHSTCLCALFLQSLVLSSYIQLFALSTQALLCD